MFPEDTSSEGSGSSSSEEKPKAKRGFDLGDFQPRPDAKPPAKKPYAPREGRDSRGSGDRGARSDNRGSGSGYGSRGSSSGGGQGGYGERSYGPRKEGPRGESGGYSRGPRPAGKPWEDRGESRGPARGGERSGGYGAPRSSERGGSYGAPRGAERPPRGRFDGDRGETRRPPYGEGAGSGPRAPYRGRYPRSEEGGFDAKPPRLSEGGSASEGMDAGFTPKASPEVRIWLQLKTDKGRTRHGRFLLEGAKAIADLLALDPGILVEIYVGPSFKDDALLAALKKGKIGIHEVTDTDISLLSDTETPQGIVAVANFAALKPNWNTAHHITLLDGIQDPGNLGGIIRTSLALGMDAIVLGKGCCDPYNAKVLRSSVGAFMRMPCEVDMDLPAKLSFLRQKGFQIVATSSHAQQTMDQATLKKKVALVMGNEGAGSGPNLLDLADVVVKIPLKKNVESLNVAVAHGILCHDLMRHRGAQLS